MLNVVVLIVTICFCYTECHYAECYYAECRYDKCRYAECRGASKTAVPDIITTITTLFYKVDLYLSILQQLSAIQLHVTLTVVEVT